VRVLDIGCGASLIYPLLGAAMTGWRFVGVDVTPTAYEWAARNAAANPKLAPLIEVRRVGLGDDPPPISEGEFVHMSSVLLGPAIRQVIFKTSSLESPDGDPGLQ
jgi:hypothetical protein